MHLANCKAKNKNNKEVISVNSKLWIITFTVLIGLVFVFAAAAPDATALPSMGSDYNDPCGDACHTKKAPTPAPAPKQEAPKEQKPAAPKAAAPAPAPKAPAFDKVSITVNNNKVEVVMIENTTLITARELGNITGAELAWDGATKGITFTLGDKSVTVFLDKEEAKVNGNDAKAPVKTQSIDGNNMVPVRFVSESLGFTVHYTPGNISIYQE